MHSGHKPCHLRYHLSYALGSRARISKQTSDDAIMFVFMKALGSRVHGSDYSNESVKQAKALSLLFIYYLKILAM